MNDWRTQLLGEVARIEIGGTPSRNEPSYWATEQEDGFAWAAISDVGPRLIYKTAERITSKGVQSSNTKLVPAGTVIMSFKLTIGRTSFAGADLFTNEAIAAFFVDLNQIDPKFLFYMLPKAAQAAVADTAIKGSTLNKDKLRRLLFSFPPLTQQRKIARILTTVDNLIEKTQTLIAKYQAIKQGMMHDLFTRGVDEHGHLRPTYEEAPDNYKQSELGWIPKEWYCELLDDVSIRGSGHTPDISVPSYWNGDIQWVSLADSANLDQIYIHRTEKRISEKGLANSSAVRHPPNTVILTRDGQRLGKSAIISTTMAVSQHFMAWQCGPRVNHLYFYYWLQKEKPQFAAIAIGSTIMTIGLSFFRKLKITVPLRHEQDLAAIRLFAVDKRLCEMRYEMNKYQMLRFGLMQDLLTGKVRVKVDDDEEVAAHA